MSENERRGNRKPRSVRGEQRTPDLGYYLIVTDTKKTEENYFYGLRDRLPEYLKNRLVIKVKRTETCNLIEFAMTVQSTDSQYRKPWIVFDRDLVDNFDQMIQAAESENISVAWSNPCFEIWFMCYLGSVQYCSSSRDCYRAFSEEFRRVTDQEYKKSDPSIYLKLNKINPDVSAIQIAEKIHRGHLAKPERKISRMNPCTTVYRLVSEIVKKIEGGIT